ncbi:uncharacterized protein LOC127080440 [Lathyrus oleraceus]|uniref:uncharacterized protein LOC127080440 n=1 Tax=Pisum sativum TaxID=3888 RepID=UPI0021D22750|nr:uncharacterized protein LOC127080440 [Pisum sativum]
MGKNTPPPERLLGDYGMANASSGRLIIVNQLVNMPNFQLHPNTINQLERRPFSGKINEDANKHLQRYLTMSTTLKIDGHTEEAKKLRMFPFTLSEDAEEWFYSFPAGSITTWEQMETTFLHEYFPASGFFKKRYDIMNFKQKEGQSLGDSYKRFKSWWLIKHFNTISIKKIIEAITANEHLELYDKCSRKHERVIDLKLETNKIRIEDTIVVEVGKKLKAMNIGTQQVAQIQPAQNVSCEICGRPHSTVYCVTTTKRIEGVNFLRQNNPYSNTYNPWWKNHHNFSWKYQKGNIQQHGQGQYHNQFQQPQQQQAPKKADLEIDIENIATHIIQFKEETINNQRNTTSSIKNLEVQMGQIAQQLADSQTLGTLSSRTVINPRERNNVSVVVTRSGKSARCSENKQVEEDKLLEVDL